MAVEMPENRGLIGWNDNLVSRVVILLPTTKARTDRVRDSQVVTSFETVTDPIATRETCNPVGAAGLVKTMS